MNHKPSSIDQEKPRGVIGYMDKTDFDYELGVALGGNSIYASIEDLRQKKSCIDECGIVEVEVTFRKVIQESKF